MYVKLTQVTLQFFFNILFFHDKFIIYLLLYYLYITVASQGCLVACTQT